MPAEKTNCFVDSNIWLYAFLQQEDNKTAQAKQIIQDKNLNLIVSTQVINEVCFNLRKKAKLSEDELQIIIENFYQNYTVLLIEKSTLLKASDLRRNNLFSYWDSLVIASALHAQAQIIYSEDMQHNLIVDHQLRIFNPFL